MLVGTAILIPLRQPSTHVGVLAMTQVLIGLGSGFFTACAQLAVMVPVTHQEVAVVIAIWGMFGSIGAAVGSAIAGGIWNNVMPEQIYDRLPEGSKNVSSVVFGDIAYQIVYEDGTPEREAIVGSYAHVQRLIVITGTAIMPLCLAAIWVWKDINVKKLRKEKGDQTKGNIW